LYKPGIIDHFGNDIYIGNFRNFPNAFTPGVIDDIKIYNRALSMEEILKLYYANCALTTINGVTEVCQGQKQVSFYVNPIYEDVSYTWNYSGTGTVIHENRNNIIIDFSNNASSGNLSVTITGENIIPQYRSIPIHVNFLPSDAGTISGEAVVCQGNTGVTYSVPVIGNSASYIWNYTGSGATISGNSSSISIDFSDQATMEI